jgi:tetratricopeptide (TPR) repeat protein
MKQDSAFNYTPVNTLQQYAYQYAVLKQLSWAETHLNAAKYYLTLGNFVRALNELRAILVSDEDNQMVLAMAGDLSLQLKLYEQAENYYLKANRFSANQFIEYKLGRTELLLGKPDLAIQFFNSAIERNGHNSGRFSSRELEEIYSGLAEAYNKNNQPDKAREVMQKLLR